MAKLLGYLLILGSLTVKAPQVSESCEASAHDFRVYLVVDLKGSRYAVRVLAGVKTCQPAEGQSVPLLTPNLPYASGPFSTRVYKCRWRRRFCVFLFPAVVYAVLVPFVGASPE